MSQKQKVKRSIISIGLIIISLFFIVFIKMEIRQRGYSLYKASKELKKMKDQKNLLSLKLAKVYRPERVRGLVMNQMSEKKWSSAQVIQMTPNGAVLKR